MQNAIEGMIGRPIAPAIASAAIDVERHGGERLADDRNACAGRSEAAGSLRIDMCADAALQAEPFTNERIIRSDAGLSALLAPQDAIKKAHRDSSRSLSVRSA
ncbi:hypothetical protein [Bosea vaviloviae]|uniref:hypothetical protein n=1 Tax=Bosea vaviloviae TaxID=1526658 RepID=UPI0020BE9A6C|nr:hypothetical protein [Bosea vaviloviae]